MNQIALSLQNHIESHTCTFILPYGNEDLVAQISQLATELNMVERDHKKAQTDMDTSMKIMQAKEGESCEYKLDCQIFEVEIKNLKEKLKGNISLI